MLGNHLIIIFYIPYFPSTHNSNTLNDKFSVLTSDEKTSFIEDMVTQVVTTVRNEINAGCVVPHSVQPNVSTAAYITASVTGTANYDEVEDQVLTIEAYEELESASWDTVMAPYMNIVNPMHTIKGRIRPISTKVDNHSGYAIESLWRKWFYESNH